MDLLMERPCQESSNCMEVFAKVKAPREVARLGKALEQVVDKGVRLALLTGATAVWYRFLEAERRQRRDALFDSMSCQVRAAKRCRRVFEDSLARLVPMSCAVAAWRAEARCGRERRLRHKTSVHVHRRQQLDAKAWALWRVLVVWRDELRARRMNRLRGFRASRTGASPDRDSSPACFTLDADGTDTLLSRHSATDPVLKKVEELDGLCERERSRSRGCELNRDLTPLNLIRATPNRGTPNRQRRRSPQYRGSLGSPVEAASPKQQVHLSKRMPDQSGSLELPPWRDDRAAITGSLRSGTPTSKRTSKQSTDAADISQCKAQQSLLRCSSQQDASLDPPVPGLDSGSPRPNGWSATMHRGGERSMTSPGRLERETIYEPRQPALWERSDSNISSADVHVVRPHQISCFTSGDLRHAASREDDKGRLMEESGTEHHARQSLVSDQPLQHLPQQEDAGPMFPNLKRSEAGSLNIPAGPVIPWQASPYVQHFLPGGSANLPVFSRARGQPEVREEALRRARPHPSPEHSPERTAASSRLALPVSVGLSQRSFSGPLRSSPSPPKHIVRESRPQAAAPAAHGRPAQQHALSPRPQNPFAGGTTAEQTPRRGPERFFYDTSSYTGVARYGGGPQSRDVNTVTSPRICPTLYPYARPGQQQRVRRVSGFRKQPVTCNVDTHS